MSELKPPEKLQEIIAGQSDRESLHPSLRPQPERVEQKAASLKAPRDAPLPSGIPVERLTPISYSDDVETLTRSSHASIGNSGARSVRPPGMILLHDERKGNFFETSLVCLKACTEVERSRIWHEFIHLGVRSVPFTSLVLSCVGAILVYQAGVQALRLVPDTSQIGPAYFELLVRDLAAALTGLMLAARVGAAIAAELGSMKVTDQLDALRLSKADPIVYLVAPKLIASLLFTPIVSFIAGACALASGSITGAVAFNIRPETFLDLRFFVVGSALIGLMKALTFGLLIPLLSAHYGIYCERGSQGVGDATTKAVVSSSLAVIIFGFVWGLLGYGVLK